jgi:hypothetical protein
MRYFAGGAVLILYTVNHIECTSHSLGATSLWPAGLPKAIKYDERVPWNWRSKHNPRMVKTSDHKR